MGISALPTRAVTRKKDELMTKQTLKETTGLVFLMIFFTVLWSLLLLRAFGAHPLPITGLVVLLLYALFLLAGAMRTIRSVQALPDPDLDQAAARKQQSDSRAFRSIVGAGVLLIILAVIILNTVGKSSYIGPVAVLITGLLLFPIGLLFRSPTLAILGIPIVVWVVLRNK